MGVIERKEKKDADVNGVDDVNNKDEKGMNDMYSAIKKNKEKININRGRRGEDTGWIGLV